MNTPTPAGVSLSAPEQGLAKERRVILQADRVMRVYIAGPMTGLPEFNFPAFNAMAEVLRADGWHVENPAEHGHVDGAEWADYLRYDISRLSTCSAMMLLPGWSSSRGARLEISIAKELGHEMLYAVGAEQMPSDFDRVTAERDALQVLLTTADELADHNARVSAIAVEDVLLLQKRVDVLEGALREVVHNYHHGHLKNTHAAIQQADELLTAEPEPCTWTSLEFSWQSSCGMTGWEFTDGGTPAENGMKFCHCCGKSIAAEVQDDE